MITVPLINWQPIANIPEDRKDGREMLLWNGGADVGSWDERYDGTPGWIESQEWMPLENVTHWADINPPA